MANFFKLINITGSLPKRHAKKNSTVSIKYGEKFKGSTKELAPGAEIFIICDRLPMNIQKLNLEKLIIVNRITENEYKRKQRKALIPKIMKKVVEPVVAIVEEKTMDEPVVTIIEEKIEEKPKKQYRRKKTITK